jgi:mycothiol synthase
VLALLRAAEREHGGETSLVLADVTDRWNGEGFDREHDAVVAHDPQDALVGYAAIAAHWSEAVVAPGREGEGIGTALLRWTEARERELGREFHRQGIPPGNERARALLTGAGYEHVFSYLRMSADPSRTAVPELPAGYTLRAVDPDRDGATLHAVDAASFAEVADYEPESPELFTERFLRAHDFDPTLSRIAEHAGEVAGFQLSNRREADVSGFVSVLAVAPGHRRRGLARTLLLDAFARYARAGLTRAELTVLSLNEQARALYAGAGMEVLDRLDVFERPTT